MLLKTLDDITLHFAGKLGFFTYCFFVADMTRAEAQNHYIKLNVAFANSEKLANRNYLNKYLNQFIKIYPISKLLEINQDNYKDNDIILTVYCQCFKRFYEAYVEHQDQLFVDFVNKENLTTQATIFLQKIFIAEQKTTIEKVTHLIVDRVYNDFKNLYPQIKNNV